MQSTLADRPSPSTASLRWPAPTIHPAFDADASAAPSLEPSLQPSAQISPLLRQVLDVMAHALVLVDDSGQVLHANAAARAQCRTGAPVALAGGRLCLADGTDHRMQAAIRAARGGQWSMLTVRSAAQVMSVGVVPMEGLGQDGPGHHGHHGQHSAGPHRTVAALLVLGSNSGPSMLALQFFCQSRQLTSAESSVLEGLCKGLAPTEIAAAGSVAVCTVRTHITAIRQKVDASSISHLLHLVSGLPPMASLGAA